jgi:hypothetical protein
MDQPSDYKGRVKRTNLEKEKYVRERLAKEFEAIADNFSGHIGVDIPISEGRIGKVKFTKSDHLKE